MSRVLWALLSYPLSLLVAFMGIVFPLEGMSGLLYLNLMFLTWIILAVWFGVIYFKYASLKDRKGFLRLMKVNTLSLVLMFLIMLALRLEHIVEIGSVAVVSSASCFIVFSMLGFACKQMDG